MVDIIRDLENMFGGAIDEVSEWLDGHLGTFHMAPWGFDEDLSENRDHATFLTPVGNTIDARSGNDRILVGTFGNNNVDGDGGNDHISGIGSSNDLYGNNGNDTLEAAGWENHLDGGNGNDLLRGLAFENTLLGGAGNDRIEALGGINKILGGIGDDSVFAIGGVNHIQGDGDGITQWMLDMMRMSKEEYVASRGLTMAQWRDLHGGDDTIEATGGVNTILAGGGNDVVSARGGVNIVDAGDGNDRITADLGAVNVIEGKGGNDSITAFGGVNLVFGGEGDDRAVLAGGVNAVDGQGGNDVMVASGAGNAMLGGAGDDKLFAAGSFNAQAGGAGDDLAVAVGLTNLQFGGSGHDRLWALGKMNGQMGNSGDDVMIAAGIDANAQAGGSGDDLLVAAGVFHNLQLGGNDDDTLIAFGTGSVQFGDNLVDFASAGADVLDWIGVNIDTRVIDALVDTLGGVSGVVVDTISTVRGTLLQEDKFGPASMVDGVLEVLEDGVEDIAATSGRLRFNLSTRSLEWVDDGGDNTMIALGHQNLQIGGAGSDIALGLGGGNVQLTGGGADVAVAMGLTAWQVTGEGNDVLLAAAQGAIQSAGAGNDMLVGGTMNLAKAYGISVGATAQFGDDGNDVLLGTALDTLTLNTSGTRTSLVSVAEIALTAQVGGAGEDLMIGTGDAGLQIGGAGDDVGIGGGARNAMFGGDGADAFLLGNPLSVLDTLAAYLGGESDTAVAAQVSAGNVFSGDDGDDLILGTGTAIKMLVDAGLDAMPFVDALRALEAGIEAALGPVKQVIDTLAALVPEIDLPDLGEIFLSADVLVGGAGNDVLGGEGFGERLVGNEGDDTYVAFFDAGETTIAENSLGGADSELLSEMATAAGGIDGVGMSVPGGEAGGHDTLEIYRFGVGALDIEDLAFSLAEDDASVLVIEAGEGRIRIEGMGGTDTGIETLRLIDGEDRFEFDLDAIYRQTRDGALDTGTLVGEATADAATTEGLAGIIDDAIAHFGTVAQDSAGAVADRFRDAYDAAVEQIDRVLPDLPDLGDIPAEDRPDAPDLPWAEPTEAPQAPTLPGGFPLPFPWPGAEETPDQGSVASLLDGFDFL